ncbi:MAG: N-acyl-L-amino acid amidohydrolase [Rhodothermaceae bacterium]|nr:MAG: N-acyl-L-amino acid amidohydrolase [Rhodothermaceae bacterium]
MKRLVLLLLALWMFSTEGKAQAPEALRAAIDRAVEASTEHVVAWRRDIHANPELSNREFRTAAKVAEHLKALGMEVRTGIAHTGVVGVLRGGRPGPVVALRADMDALPVTEEVDLPFASKVRATYNGQEVGVMHACGHDNHVAILMGVAEVLASVKDDLPGTVLFIFQPAEEGAPAGEEGGAELMLEEGAFDNPRPDAVFGLHVVPHWEVGQIAVRPGGIMAASDGLFIRVQGRQAHGAYPWLGIDPVTVAAQITLALQTIPSRQLDVTNAPAVVSIGSLHGGVRGNIIPETVEMTGTIRTFDTAMQADLHERIRRTATKIAESAGATAEVRIDLGYPVTYNDPELTAAMLPTLRRVAEVVEAPRQMGAEDFSFFAREVPGLYFLMGIRTPGAPREDFPVNHSPRFRVDEAALPVGVRALAHLAADYLWMHSAE